MDDIEGEDVDVYNVEEDLEDIDGEEVEDKGEEEDGDDVEEGERLKRKMISRI